MKTRRLHIIRDTREQDGYTFQSGSLDLGRGFNQPPLVTVGTIVTGDYSIKGFTKRVTVERKNPNDLVKSLTDDRERFKAELERMVEMDAPLIVIEAPQSFFLAGHHNGGTSGKSIIQSMRSIRADYRVPWEFCLDPEDAAQVTYDHLRHFFEHREKGRKSYMERAVLRQWGREWDEVDSKTIN